jgi:hypothetical protein
LETGNKTEYEEEDEDDEVEGTGYFSGSARQ